MQRERRRDPYPWTWEPPAAVAALGVLLLVVGVQLGRATANLFVGAGWTWPAADPGGTAAGRSPTPLSGTFWSSLPEVLGGDAAAGLPDPPAAVAGPSLLAASILLVEAATLGLLTWAVVVCYVRWGPGRMHGMATRGQAEALLGLTRLRKSAAIVRPDLHDTRRTRRSNTTTHTQAPAPDRPPGEATGLGRSSRLGRGLSRRWLPTRATTSSGDPQ